MRKNRILWLFLLAAAGVLCFFENNTATRCVFAAAALIPLLLLVLSAAAVRRLHISLSVPSEVQKNISFALSLTVKCRIPVPVLHGELRIVNLLTGEQQRLSMAASTARRDALRLDGSSACCGALRLSLSGWASDPFDLKRFPLPELPQAHVFVRPELYLPELTLVEDGSADSGECYSAVRPGFDPSEIFSVREYRPGDPIRQIHWKLSQKAGKTMLRELGQPISDQLLLAFDALAPDAQESPAAIAAAAELFLSVSRSLALRGSSHSVCWQRSADSAPLLCRVESEPDYAELEAAFFATDFHSRQAARTGKPDGHFAHAALFSPAFPADDGGFADADRCSVFAPEGHSAPEYHAICFSPTAFREELTQIEL